MRNKISIDFNTLSHRVGTYHLEKRLRKQTQLAAKFYSKGAYSSFHVEYSEPLHYLIKYVLLAFNHYQHGLKNGIAYQVHRHTVYLNRLPKAFDGFTILQLTDIHSDSIIDKGSKLCGILKGIKADLCVITGDFRTMIYDNYLPTIEVTEKIVKSIHAPSGILGILGNHDFIEFVPWLEEIGIQMLINESVQLQKADDSIWLAGIDDPHFYDVDDMAIAGKDIPDNAMKILLSHSPETYKDAETAGYDYMLSGHTHGGQICLPGGIPIITNASCPRYYCVGDWKYKKLQGYTSRGTGASGIPVRFFCPPEITIHQLKKGD